MLFRSTDKHPAQVLIFFVLAELDSLVLHPKSLTWSGLRPFQLLPNYILSISMQILDKLWISRII